MTATSAVAGSVNLNWGPGVSRQWGQIKPVSSGPCWRAALVRWGVCRVVGWARVLMPMPKTALRAAGVGVGVEQRRWESLGRLFGSGSARNPLQLVHELAFRAASSMVATYPRHHAASGDEPACSESKPVAPSSCSRRMSACPAC